MRPEGRLNNQALRECADKTPRNSLSKNACSCVLPPVRGEPGSEVAYSVMVQSVREAKQEQAVFATAHLNLRAALKSKLAPMKEARVPSGMNARRMPVANCRVLCAHDICLPQCLAPTLSGCSMDISARTTHPLEIAFSKRADTASGSASAAFQLPMQSVSHCMLRGNSDRPPVSTLTAEYPASLAASQVHSKSDATRWYANFANRPSQLSTPRDSRSVTERACAPQRTAASLAPNNGHTRLSLLHALASASNSFLALRRCQELARVLRTPAMLACFVGRLQRAAPCWMQGRTRSTKILRMACCAGMHRRLEPCHAGWRLFKHCSLLLLCHM